jgi:hypothetical protein
VRKSKSRYFDSLTLAQRDNSGFVVPTLSQSTRKDGAAPRPKMTTELENSALVQVEADFDVHRDWDWLAGFFVECGLELVLTNGFEGLFVESHAE